MTYIGTILLVACLSVTFFSSSVWSSPAPASPALATEDTSRATFTAEFDGAITALLRGNAMFDARTVDGDSYFKIILYRYTDDNNFEAINILGFDLLLPAVGEVALSGSEQYTAAYMAVSGGVTTIGALESGWLRFDRVLSDEVYGAFELQGEIVDKDGGRSFSVRGRFHAQRQDERELPTAFR